jgi:hypothetical protein
MNKANNVAWHKHLKKGKKIREQRKALAKSIK